MHDHRGRKGRLPAQERERQLEAARKLDKALRKRERRLPPPPSSEDLAEIRDIIAGAAPEDAPAAAPVAETAKVTPIGPVGSGSLPERRDFWSTIPMVELDGAALDRNLVITARRRDPAHAAFDVLRTRIVQAMTDRGWSRIGITSPTRGCGKSFTAVNLGITLSRYDAFRTLLMEMDLRHSGLGRYLGLQPKEGMGDFLRGQIGPDRILRRVAPNKLSIGPNFAVGLNGRPEPFAAELFQEARTREILDALQDNLKPDLLLYDLPPALAQDDVLAFAPRLDCILMVVGGGTTKADEVREVVRRLGEEKPVLGIVMNKAEDAVDYTY